MNYKSLLLKILFSLTMLFIVGMQVDFSQIKLMAANIHPFSWISAMALIFLQMGFLALRWLLLVNAGVVKRINLRTAWRITSASFLANYLFITSLGGIITRIGLTMSQNFPFVKSLAATIIDRGMTLLSLIILAAVFVPFIGNSFQFEFKNIIILVATLAFIASLLFVILYKYRRLIIFMNRKVTICCKYLRNLLEDPVRIVKIILVSLMGQLLYFAAVYVVMYSLAIDFSFIKFMAIMPVIAIIASLPMGYGGWGIREGAFIYGLGLIGIPAEAAFIASVQVGIISMLTSMIAGIPAFIANDTQSALRTWKIHKKERQAHANI